MAMIVVCPFNKNIPFQAIGLVRKRLFYIWKQKKLALSELLQNKKKKLLESALKHKTSIDLRKKQMETVVQTVVGWVAILSCQKSSLV